MKAFLNALKKRTGNYAFWVSLIALIPEILKLFGIDVIPEDYSTLGNTILVFLIAAGIVNNPTTNNVGYKDDETTK